ncbi:Uncharacterised protein [Escherichia coli]|nr:hypothetical protein [Escherichia coli]WEG97309.1 hypothetical protein MNFJLIIH_00067 [Escherichia coli]GIP83619.1 hypothetical protein pm083_47070 [Escherichia coli]SQP43408.1 Uncharacterised protein [Escherichia coli]SQQ92183.1 Uncharacterised protein [Escherichia coli]
MLGGADNPNGELPSYITGANKIYQSVPAYAGLRRFYSGII